LGWGVGEEDDSQWSVAGEEHIAERSYSATTLTETQTEAVAHTII
jgi:hypothetical protein